MSVTFSIRGVEVDYDNPEPGTYLNLSNANARLVLQRLGLASEDLYGSVRGEALIRLCERALKNNQDDGGTPDVEESAPGLATVIYGGQRPGYFSEKFNLLREMGVRAGQLGVIIWG